MTNTPDYTHGITKIYVDKDNCPLVGRYNGSWHVIDHETIDDTDKSVLIWENIYEACEMIENSYEGDEPIDEEQVFMYAQQSTMDMFEDLGVEIVVR
jgi:hypothetical protein